jgi:predicted nucleic-acid-binding protein
VQVAGFDTNVIVRILVGDDPVQTRKAERAFAKHAKAQGIYLTWITLAELGWVLRAAYGWSRSLIHSRLSELLRTKGVVVDDLEIVQAALDEYQRGPADFSDYLILERARQVDKDKVLLTFDSKLARSENVELL